MSEIIRQGKSHATRIVTIISDWRGEQGRVETSFVQGRGETSFGQAVERSVLVMIGVVVDARNGPI